LLKLCGIGNTEESKSPWLIVDLLACYFSLMRPQAHDLRPLRVQRAHSINITLSRALKSKCKFIRGWQEKLVVAAPATNYPLPTSLIHWLYLNNFIGAASTNCDTLPFTVKKTFAFERPLLQAFGFFGHSYFLLIWILVFLILPVASPNFRLRLLVWLPVPCFFAVCRK